MDFWKIAKQIIGYQAYEDRNEAQLTVEQAKASYEKAALQTERMKEALNDSIQELGRTRIDSICRGISPFIACLKDIKQNCGVGDFTALGEVEIRQEQIQDLEGLEMTASEVMAGTVAASVVGAMALTGVPAAVTSAVTAFAAASTGTAISSLSGAAASNAVMAWIGGGSLTAGGGGVAAGVATLSAVSWAATGGVALLTAGLIASAHYSKKLTEAKEYQKEVEVAVANMKKAWVVMKGINDRVAELGEVTEAVVARTLEEMKYLKPLVPDFDQEDDYQLEVFQKCWLLVKTVGTLARTPLLTDDGNLTEESSIVVHAAKSAIAH